MNSRPPLFLACLVSAPVLAGGIALVDAPFVTEGSVSVKSNLLFILDNSGSMNWDYLPDYVVDNKWCKDETGKVYDASGKGMRCCRNTSWTTGDSSNTNSVGSTGTNTTCLPNSGASSLETSAYAYTGLRGMPPFHTSDFNNIYYNPEKTYDVPLNHDGSKKTSYSGSSVPWDGYSSQYDISKTMTLTTSFPDVEWCVGSSTDCLRADNYLVPGVVDTKSYTTMKAVSATGSKSFVSGTPTAPTISTKTTGPYFYSIIPGEYCSTKKLTSCVVQHQATTAYKYPAKVRWCNDKSLMTTDDPGTTTKVESCQALRTESTHKYPLYPTILLKDAVSPSQSVGKITVSNVPQSAKYSNVRPTCTIIGETGTCTAGTVTGCINQTSGKTVVSSIKLFSDEHPSGTEILTNGPLTYCDASGTQTTRNNNLANFIDDYIGGGFSDSRGNAIITLTAPDGSYNSATLSSDITGAKLAITTPFGGSLGSPASFAAGSWKRTDIVPGTDYGNICISSSGTVTSRTGACISGEKAVVDRTGRRDCSAAPKCTYTEEITNFSNWFAWHRSRMQMMKTAVSQSFQEIDDKVRIGYMTLTGANMSSSTSYTGGLNIDDFDSTWKNTWFAKIFKEKPSSDTPLRKALSNAGLLFAGKSVSGISNDKDPVQYSCQKNFSILSTDGYWNGSEGVDLGENTFPSGTDNDGDGNTKTLADIAYYYYDTDLRTSGSDCSNPSTENLEGVDYSGLCANDVPTNLPDDPKTTQRMITYTLGLGIDGVMQYRRDYNQTPSAEDLPDDYQAVVNGATANPADGTCSWMASGEKCKWPTPGSDKQENIDDLWHAAVNGKGAYYQAKSAEDLKESLKDILLKIKATTGAAAAATTSNPNVTNADNFVFSSSFTTYDWYGELVRQTIDTSSGAINPANDWSFQQQMDEAGERGTVTTWDSAAGKKNFTYALLNSADAAVCAPPTNEKGCFNSPRISSWSQWGDLLAAEKTDAAGDNLIKFLKGNQTYEGTLYRDRVHTLGDIVSSEAVYLGRYLYSYGSGYGPQDKLRSNPTVMVSANDGMLHALDANTGAPRWSHIPSMALPNLYKLADKGYKYNHRYFVDGTPVAADIYSGSWKTIVVAGLAGGGQGYFALDVSDDKITSANPLWEFRKRDASLCTTDPGLQKIGNVVYDCDLGYSFGNPVIAKVGGTWVVMVTSGYNNHVDGGDGDGYLYVLDAYTGSPIKKIKTNVGNTTTPSGLSKIIGWSDNAMTENVVQYVYGGDYLGNLWKFDVVAGTASLLKSFGPTQPITARPEVGLVVGAGKNKPVVFVPTGSLVGANDLSTTDQQSFYAIWDAARNSMSAPSTLVTSAVSGGADTDHSASGCNSVFDDDSNLGWKINFPVSKERGTTDPTLAFGTLVFSTNAPGSSSVCNPSGFDSWVWNVDYKCGGAIQNPVGNTNIAEYYEGMSTRPNVFVLPNGTVKSITRVSGVEVTNNVDNVRITPTSGNLRKVSWRELFGKH